jgi:hypothetical protein
MLFETYAVDTDKPMIDSILLLVNLLITDVCNQLDVVVSM